MREGEANSAPQSGSAIPHRPLEPATRFEIVATAIVGLLIVLVVALAAAVMLRMHDLSVTNATPATPSARTGAGMPFA